MSHTCRIALALSASLALAACQAGPAESPASPPQGAGAAQAVPSTGGGPDASSSGSFVPSDGRLTSAQVQQYIAVRRRALELAKSDGPAAPSLPQLLSRIPPSEARAAGELGRDLREYQWVQARIAEVVGPVDGDEVLRAIDEAVAKSGARIAEIARDEGQRVNRVDSLDSVVVHNRAVVQPFVEEILTLEQDQLRKGR